jgi:hypothetical protein
MEKIQFFFIKDHISTTLCTSSKLFYLHNYFFVFYLLCTLSIKHKKN